METLSDWAMALAVIAAFVLVLGGARLARTHATRKQGVLMIVAAAVMLVNVLIWTL